MNDTPRELGSALGIAVLGSLLSSGYTSNLAGSLAHLPATRPALEQAAP